MRAFGIFLLSLAFFPILSGQINHWETAVNFNDTWKYFPGTAEPDVNWPRETFNDASWASGTGGVGFGDGDDNTVISLVPSLYLRRSFTIADTSVILQGLLSIDYDDGFIVYLNNVEIARSNLGTTAGDRPPYTQYANAQHEALMYAGGSAEQFIVPRSVLRSCMKPGTNVLAVTVHNATVNSADMTSLTWLHFGISNSTTYFGPNPPWFTPPLASSDLPLVWIDTQGGIINDSIRVTAQMGIIYNGPGLRNYLSDPFNNYNGEITIEYRGSTSQQYPKKSYGIETVDSLGLNNNVPILGMPAENDWVLYAPYPDKTMMRNTLAYDLFGRMQHYSPRTRFCEVLVNGQYMGVFEFHERIKIDDNRLDLPQLDVDDLAGDSLTGGYIVKVDKQTGTGAANWYSPINPNVYFQFHDPEETELMPAQKTYIEDYVTDFETALNGPNFSDPVLGYRPYIDVQSFMDFLIMQELGRTVDGYRSSSFLHKQVNRYGGKLSAGPMWDFNLSFGNADYCDAFLTSGWQYNFGQVCTGYVPEVPFWWGKLMTDTRFRNEIGCRWDDLRTGPLNTDSVHNWIDSVAAVLNESQARNFQRWPILGQYVNWNYFVGNTYQEEIDYMKQWIADRLTWLDANMPAAPGSCNSPNAGDIQLTEINYNSAAGLDAGDWIELHNSGAGAVDLSDWKLKNSNPDNVFTLPAGTSIPAGGYLVLVQDTAAFHSRHASVNNIVGPFHFKLENNGDRLRVFDSFYSEVISMRYDDTLPWPQTADGGGFTMEVTNASGNLSDGNNWFAGCPEGSPGVAYFTPCLTSVHNGLLAAVQLFPNPSSGEVHVTGTEQTPWIVVYSVLGEELLSVRGTAFEVSELPAGIYFVKVSVEQGQVVKRLVKQ